jgi:uncharacterized integral membrane protein
MKPKIILIAVLLVLLGVLLIQNAQEVVFRVFFWQISMSQVILVPLAVLVGFILGYVAAKIEKKRDKPGQK